MSGPETNGNGQIVKREERPGDNLIALVNRGAAQIARALPKHINPDRMARAVLTAMRLNPDLYHSDEASFISSMLTLAQLGLEPNTPLQQAFLIPRRNSKNGGRWETTVQLGYRGYIDLAYRSGLVSGIHATPVFPGDAFHWQRGTDPRIDHVPADGEDRVDYTLVTHVYAVAKIRGGDPLFEVLTREQVNQRRLRSARPDGGAWASDPIPMMLKTAIRALWRTLPMSADMAAAAAVDDAYDLQRPIATAVPAGPATDVLERLGMQGEGAMLDVHDAPTGPQPRLGEHQGIRWVQWTTRPDGRWLGEWDGSPTFGKGTVSCAVGGQDVTHETGTKPNGPVITGAAAMWRAQ